MDSTALAAAEAAAEAEVSGDVAEPSSDLLQAIPAKNMETRARTRNLRIISSFVHPRWLNAQRSNRRQNTEG